MSETVKENGKETVLSLIGKTEKPWGKQKQMHSLREKKPKDYKISNARKILPGPKRLTMNAKTTDLRIHRNALASHGGNLPCPCS